LGVELVVHATTGGGNNNIQFGSEAFANCPSLVNIALSSVNDDIPQDVFSGCSRLGVNDDDQGNHDDNLIVLAALQHRFAELPIHEACYHSSTTSTEDLLAHIHHHHQSLSNDWRDSFGVTPFHLIATSAAHRIIDILQVLLDHIPFSVLSHKDCNGNTMMDYLLQNRLSTSILLIKMVLHRTLVDGMAPSWGMKCWRLSLCNSIDDSSRQWGTAAAEQTTKQQALQQVIQKLESYARIEVTSLLELAVWNTKMDSIGGTSGQQQVNRDGCRLLCGANLVKANVLPYIWDDNNKSAKACVALSMFPYDVSWMCAG